MTNPIATHCPSCGTKWTEHLGCAGLCEELQALRNSNRMTAEESEEVISCLFGKVERLEKLIRSWKTEEELWHERELELLRQIERLRDCERIAWGLANDLVYLDSGDIVLWNEDADENPDVIIGEEILLCFAGKINLDNCPWPDTARAIIDAIMRGSDDKK